MHHGLCSMAFSNVDKAWLRDNYPKLEVTDTQISGAIDIYATYNLESKRFLDVERASTDDVGGIRLSGTLSVTITERSVSERKFSNLPKVVFQSIDADADRHINPSDNCACLCSPLEESPYLLPSFQISKFFEELLIPFLYGQLFFTAFGSWPWPDYGHGAVGVLESYDYLSDSSQAASCLKTLSGYKREGGSIWIEMRSFLLQKNEIKGHMACLCEKRDKIRKCHPKAWQGLRKLRRDIREQGLIIPE